MNTKNVGDKTEAIILAEFLRAGKNVLLPFGDNQRYDMVIDDDGKFIRVQCKTARLSDDGGCLVFSTSSIGAGRKHIGYHGQIDFFAVYSPDTNKVYLLHVDDTTKHSMLLSMNLLIEVAYVVQW